MRHMWSCFGGLVLVGTVAGCAPHRAVGYHAERPYATPVMLEVNNRSWHDVDIFLARGGVVTRLGTVTAAAVQRFPAAPYLVRSQFQLIGRVIGSDASVTTDDITVRPGQHVQWVLGNDIEYSSVSVWAADSI